MKPLHSKDLHLRKKGRKKTVTKVNGCFYFCAMMELKPRLYKAGQQSMKTQACHLLGCLFTGINSNHVELLMKSCHAMDMKVPLS